MTKGRSLRFRMMVLFCTLVGVLLGASYLAFWSLLAHEVSAQLNRQLQETARPILADLVAEPSSQDINRMDIPGQFFELLDPSGQVLQRSRNLSGPINLQGRGPSPAEATFGSAALATGESVRLALLPFRQGAKPLVLAIAIPTFGTNRVLDSFGRIAVFLFLASLLATALISALYVGRSLAPVIALTEHASLMANRVTHREGFWKPLPVSSPHDELARLAETFNHLLQSVDSAVRQLRQFVTDASHELRTPLSVLHGETELMLSKPRTVDEYRETLCVFDDEFKKLTRIVEGLFTLSMADAGQLHLIGEPLYINETLEEACALVSSRARAKNIGILRQLDEELPYFGDEAFLHQLFLIFLDNAIKYSPGGTNVRVELENRGSEVRVSFTDQGVGISCEHLPFIFERFYRAAPASSGEAQSGGLGLAIAQAIVRAQGGSIECTSQLGVGSTFTVLLPITHPHKYDTQLTPKRKLILH
jgi:two-component system, OmpR family, sensor kinase